MKQLKALLELLEPLDESSHLAFLDLALKHIGASNIEDAIEKLHGNDELKHKLLTFFLEATDKSPDDAMDVMLSSKQIATAYRKKFDEPIGFGKVAAKMGRGVVG